MQVYMCSRKIQQFRKNKIITVSSKSFNQEYVETNEFSIK